MDISAGAQVAIFFAVLLLAVKPLGAFMAKVYQGERTFLSPVLAPCREAALPDLRGEHGRGDGLEALCRRHAPLQPGAAS